MSKRFIIIKTINYQSSTYQLPIKTMHKCEGISESDYDTSPEAFAKGRARDEGNPMERTGILCFPSQNAVTLKLLKERQKLSAEDIKKLDLELHSFVNSRGYKWEAVQKFNRASGLYVHFKPGSHWYSIEFKYDGRDVFFEACYQMHNGVDYDSDGEEDKKLSSLVYVPFERLYPVQKGDTKVLTIEMYFDFVVKCLTMKVADHVYRR
jgi:hypothetical protein